jgi:dipeptidyl-peptidase 4
MRMRALLLSASLALTLGAQGTKADFQREKDLGKALHAELGTMRVDPTWSTDGGFFWYRKNLAGGAHRWIAVTAKDGRKRPAFDHARLAVLLGHELGRAVAEDHLPLSNVAFSADASHLQFATEEGWWDLDLKGHRLAKGKAPEGFGAHVPGPFDDPLPTRTDKPVPSPDGHYVAQLVASNIVIRSCTGREVFRTTDGVTSNPYTGALDWSPDGTKLVAQRATEVPIHKVTFVESSPSDQLQPKVHVNDYAKPGDPLPEVRPTLINVQEGKVYPPDPSLAPTPFNSYGEDLSITWAENSSRFYYVYNQRGHQVLRVISCDAATGASKVVVDEQSRTFIDYSGKQFLQVLHDTNELVWMSERSGWNHLYLVDALTGAVKNPITQGEWVVRSVLKVDAKTRQVYFLAGGIVPGQDPYYQHLVRVNFDGTGLKVLTEGNGTHDVTLSPDQSTFVDVWSRVDMAPIAELRRTRDGAKVVEFEHFDVAGMLKAGWKLPEPFKAKGRDGKTDIYGVIFRPSNYDPAKKYPVIEYIYAGPQDSFCPKAFGSMDLMTELGFIMVSIDGMGTSNRSKAFHDVCWKNLGDAGFPDRILWMKAAAAKDPAMDISRVGIYGGSAGGQDALRALLGFGDFYKAAVADCGCHDNRMDKVWWNEQWMGWPIGPEYAEQSNVTNAPKLKGDLLLLVGEMDTNVDPATTLQVVNALLKADKDFEMLVVPGSDHGTMHYPPVNRRLKDFFVRHLLGVTPREH